MVFGLDQLQKKKLIKKMYQVLESQKCFTDGIFYKTEVAGRNVSVVYW